MHFCTHVHLLDHLLKKIWHVSLKTFKSLVEPLASHKWPPFCPMSIQSQDFIISGINADIIKILYILLTLAIVLIVLVVTICRCNLYASFNHLFQTFPLSKTNFTMFNRFLIYDGLKFASIKTFACNKNY